jgi:hypothetical protein
LPVRTCLGSVALPVTIVVAVLRGRSGRADEGGGSGEDGEIELHLECVSFSVDVCCGGVDVGIVRMVEKMTGCKKDLPSSLSI